MCENFLRRPAAHGKGVDVRTAAAIELQRYVTTAIDGSFTLRRTTRAEITSGDRRGEVEVCEDVTTVTPAQVIASVTILDDIFSQHQQRRRKEQAQVERKLARKSAIARATK